MLIKVLAPCFYAREDTRTPVRIAVACVVANTAMALLLMGPLGHVGIALATALSAWMNCALLARGLARRGLLAPGRRTLRRALGALAASLAMAAALEGALRLGLSPAASHGVARWAAMAGLVVIGLCTYAAAGAALGAFRPAEVASMFRRPPAA